MGLRESLSWEAPDRVTEYAVDPTESGVFNPANGKTRIFRTVETRIVKKWYALTQAAAISAVETYAGQHSAVATCVNEQIGSYEVTLTEVEYEYSSYQLEDD